MKATARIKANRKKGGGRSRRGAAPSKYSGAVTVIAVIVLWFFFAPSQVGGWAAYVIVNGNSMEPDFHKGDLVITREEPSGGYEVGDVVAYLHPDIGPVIHRIVERDGERFILQGDNNSWLDSYNPVEDEVIGKSWIHIPSAGKVLGAMHSPVGILALSLTMGVIVMMSFSTAGDRKNKKRNGGSAKGIRPDWATVVGKTPGSGGPPGVSSKDVEGMITLFGAVLLASLFLGFLAFTRPATVPATGDVGFRNTGEFGYTANVPTDIYEDGEIKSGEPVFRKVTDRVEVKFDYLLDSPLPTDGVTGTYRLDAEVSDVNGWSRTFPLRPETSFSGGEFTASGILDLAEIQEATTTLEEETGVSTDRFAVSVVPSVTLGGQLGGQPVDDTFSPSLDFWLDDNQMQLQTPASVGADSADATSVVGEEAAVDPLAPTEDGSVAGSATQANALSVFGLEIGIGLARVIAVLGVIVSAAGLIRFGLPVLNARQSDDEPTRIQAKHADKLVSVSARPFDNEKSAAAIPLTSFEDLVKVAEMAEVSILHYVEGRVHHYHVLDADKVYGYRSVASMDGEEQEAGESGKPFIEMVREMWR